MANPTRKPGFVRCSKLGERFVKKIFDHAVHAEVEEIYVTVFAKHIGLISLLTRYGFEPQAAKRTANGEELVLVKQMAAPYRNELKSYPLVNLRGTRAYLLALYPVWHTRLLPDSILRTETADIVQDISHTNSIHKVYLAAMPKMETLRRGDVLLIYRTSDEQGPARYRSVATSICVLEEYRSIRSFDNRDEFLAYCRPFSVFSDDELQRFWVEKKYPHIIRFTYNICAEKNGLPEVT